jgi:IS5 family transposase
MCQKVHKRKQLVAKMEHALKKDLKVFFGFKSHDLVDRKHGLIRETELTTASKHDSKIDLSTNKKQVVYRDKEYNGAKCEGYDVTIQKTKKR